MIRTTLRTVPRDGTITIPAEARRVLRLDLPGAQVEVTLRDHDLVLIPHVPLEGGPRQRHRALPRQRLASRPPGGHLRRPDAPWRAAAMAAGRTAGNPGANAGRGSRREPRRVLEAMRFG